MLFYITFVDLNSDFAIGVWKKVTEQAEAMGEMLGKVYYTGWSYPKAVLINGTETVETELAVTRKDYVEVLEYWMKKHGVTQTYIRYPVANKWFMDLLRYQKEHDIKTVLEFPTYPYDKEMQDGVFKSEDIFYRGEVCKYVDRATTYTADNVIWNIPCIQLYNGISLQGVQLQKKRKGKKSGNKIVLLTMSTMKIGHGYERILEGLYLYYKCCGKYDIRLKMIGIGPEKQKYENLVDKYDLNMKVEFLGRIEPWETEKLDIQYGLSDIAFGPLGGYKTGLQKSSPIKGAEYCARGIPMVCGYHDLRFPADWEFIMNVPNNSDPINMNDVINFYETVTSREDYQKIMYQYAEKHLTWNTILKPVISYYLQQ